MNVGGYKKPLRHHVRTSFFFPRHFSAKQNDSNLGDKNTYSFAHWTIYKFNFAKHSTFQYGPVIKLPLQILPSIYGQPYGIGGIHLTQNYCSLIVSMPTFVPNIVIFQF